MILFMKCSDNFLSPTNGILVLFICRIIYSRCYATKYDTLASTKGGQVEKSHHYIMQQIMLHFTNNIFHLYNGCYIGCDLIKKNQHGVFWGKRRRRRRRNICIIKQHIGQAQDKDLYLIVASTFVWVSHQSFLISKNIQIK